MNLTDDRIRIKCPRGHWVTVRTVLDLVTRKRTVASAQHCPTCLVLIPVEVIR